MAQDGGGLTTSPSTTFGEPLAGAPGSTLASAACAPVCVIFSMASPIVATCARNDVGASMARRVMRAVPTRVGSTARRVMSRTYRRDAGVDFHAVHDRAI